MPIQPERIKKKLILEIGLMNQFRHRSQHARSNLLSSKITFNFRISVWDRKIKEISRRLHRIGWLQSGEGFSPSTRRFWAVWRFFVMLTTRLSDPSFRMSFFRSLFFILFRWDPLVFCRFRFVSRFEGRSAFVSGPFNKLSFRPFFFSQFLRAVCVSPSRPCRRFQGAFGSFNSLTTSL